MVIREGERTVLENAALRAELDADGSLVSLVDLATGSETIAPGARAALLQLHRDPPNAWDAWDIDEFYRRTVRDLATPLEVTAGEEDGGARVAFTYSTAAGEGEDSRGVTGAGSTIVKTFVLRPGDESLGIELDLDWKERKKALKLAFPLDVRAAHLSSEIQFGHVDRPIPVNTSWDFARFETCAHRWVHAAEGDFGVALANDSTYGHDVLRTVREFDGGTTTTIRQTLVRAPEFPDPSADKCCYRLRVALRPGAGIPGAIQEGYRLNLPEREVTAATAAGAGAPLVTVQDAAGAGAGAAPGAGSGQVLVETVKLAENRSGDLVLRLYESLGVRAEATLVLDPAPDGGAAPRAPAPDG
ncbi:alpha-mannosidase [Brachybacterium aquaticum]|uniref:Alpha-mannosidase n=1 Tax=Brachybacterium aquaticum TaxID=1432564 RepID=A0A841A8S6_9MICO|nr:glycoside hydrolase family 38 C-terminal domain-containing protein [Brachybacterium aquaticum]MBB5830337.1 alpha-mannosidase [Brachybacterium aquaticum]